MSILAQHSEGIKASTRMSTSETKKKTRNKIEYFEILREKNFIGRLTRLAHENTFSKASVIVSLQ